MTELTEAARKADLRIQLRERRTSLAAEELREREVGFVETGQALLDSLCLTSERQAITGYLPSGTEPPVLAMLAAFSSAGHQVFMPICEPERRLSWALWQPGIEMRTSDFGPIQEPVGERHGLEVFASIGLIVLPALAVDGNGNRLGQGGGYYDRLLRRLRDAEQTPVLAAAIYQEDLLPPGGLPHETLDQPVQFALTPEFFRRLEC